MFKIDFKQFLIFMLLVFIIKIVVADPIRKQYDRPELSEKSAWRTSY